MFSFYLASISGILRIESALTTLLGFAMSIKSLCSRNSPEVNLVKRGWLASEVKVLLGA